MPSTYHVAQHSSEALLLSKSGWHKQMPSNPKNYGFLKLSNITQARADEHFQTQVCPVARGTSRTHVIFWLPGNELRDGRLQRSEKLIQGLLSQRSEILLSTRLDKVSCLSSVPCSQEKPTQHIPSRFCFQSYCSTSSAAILCSHVRFPT